MILSYLTGLILVLWVWAWVSCFVMVSMWACFYDIGDHHVHFTVHILCQEHSTVSSFKVQCDFSSKWTRKHPHCSKVCTINRQKKTLYLALMLHHLEVSIRAASHLDRDEDTVILLVLSLADTWQKYVRRPINEEKLSRMKACCKRAGWSTLQAVRASSSAESQSRLPDVGQQRWGLKHKWTRSEFV